MHSFLPHSCIHFGLLSLLPLELRMSGNLQLILFFVGNLQSEKSFTKILHILCTSKKQQNELTHHQNRIYHLLMNA